MLVNSNQSNYDFTFNGKPIDMVVSADDTTGEMVVYQTHHCTGEVVSDPNEGDGKAKIKIKGKVGITKKDGVVDPPVGQCTPGHFDPTYYDPYNPHGYFPCFTAPFLIDRSNIQRVLETCSRFRALVEKLCDEV